MRTRRATAAGAIAPAAGFTLVELLVVVAVIGIISSIAVANLLNALDKARQKRSMTDLRTIATSVEAYATDISHYPIALADWPSLKAIINPYYMKTPPDADGWDNTWTVATTANGSDYTVCSLGKDNLVGPRPGGPTGEFGCDIVFTNGQFFQWPQGTQS